MKIWRYLPQYFGKLCVSSPFNGRGRTIQQDNETYSEQADGRSQYEAWADLLPEAL